MSNGRRKSRKPQKWEEFNIAADRNAPSQEEHLLAMQQARSPQTSSVERANFRSPERNDGDMTVLDILQVSKQGSLAECSICLLKFKNWHSTVDHIHFHRITYLPNCIQEASKICSGPMRCFICCWDFLSGIDLVLHAYTEHSVANQRLMCPFCGMTYDTIGKLQQHCDVTCIKMKCPVCSATYDQEYKLYSHLSECLPDFHPHLESLICHLCGSAVPVSDLADHLITHTTEAGRLIYSGTTTEEKDEDKHPDYDKKFLCEICDKRLESFAILRTHFHEHPNTSFVCPMCELKGFYNEPLLVRHCILRCPKRTPRQVSFGSFINIVGNKFPEVFFVDVIASLRIQRTLTSALQHWLEVEPVAQFLISFTSANDDTMHGLRAKSLLGSVLKTELPSDIGLLSHLTDYEKLNGVSVYPNVECDKKPDVKRVKLEHPELKTTIELPNFSSEDIKNLQDTKPLIKIEKVSPDSVQKIKGSSVSLSPETLKKKYPGVDLLPEVSVEALQRVAREAQRGKKDRVEDAIKAGVFTRDVVTRLELEAQYLRDIEPFYLPPKDYLQFSPLNLHKKKIKTESKVDPAHAQSLLEEARKLVEEKDK